MYQRREGPEKAAAISTIGSPDFGGTDGQLKSNVLRGQAHMADIFYAVARLYLARVEIAIFPTGLRYERGHSRTLEVSSVLIV